MPTAAEVVDRLATIVSQRLPPGVTPAYFAAFLHRNRVALATILDQQLAAPADLWSPAQRTAANLAAMRIAAAKRPDEMTAADRRALTAYSGWGGLSIEAVAHEFPTGFPAPEPRGLIHEYYTPTKVAREVARLVRPLVPDLPRADGVVLALEPSAGIGRFVRAATGDGFEDLRWLVVEWSELSARMLGALRGDLAVFHGPFERWVRERGPDYAGRVGLVLANPPYGARGASITEDPDRQYREKAAYAYFLRRGLDLLAPNGLGVYLVPAGFLTGRGAAATALRTRVLRRHHLSAAFRLPSKLFPGAQLVTDLLLFRARGGELPEVDAADGAIADGRYFEAFPDHILGTEVGRDAGDDDQTKRPRWGYQVEGAFDRLPDLVERPMCAACALDAPAPATLKPRRSGAARTLEEATAGLPEGAASAVALGLRVDRYLAALAAQTSDEHVQLWPELHEALLAWTARYGNPRAHGDLRALVARGHTGAERFLAAFTRTGALIPGLAARPTWTPRYAGRPDDLVALAEFTYRARRQRTVAAHQDQLGRPADRVRAEVLQRLPELLDAGWSLDGPGAERLVPARDYLTGHLWPRYDQATALVQRGNDPWGTVPVDRVAAQVRRLLDAIRPAVLEDIQGVSPRQGWVPLDLVAAWMGEALNGAYGPVQLERREGLVQPPGRDYDHIDADRELAPEVRWRSGVILCGSHTRSTCEPDRASPVASHRHDVCASPDLCGPQGDGQRRRCTRRT